MSHSIFEGRRTVDPLRKVSFPLKVLTVVTVIICSWVQHGYTSNLEKRINEARMISSVDTEKVSDILRTSSEPSVIESDLASINDVAVLKKALEEVPDAMRKAMIRAAIFQLTSAHSPRSIIKSKIMASGNQELDAQIDDNLVCVQTDSVQEIFPHSVFYAFTSPQDNPLSSVSYSSLYKCDGNDVKTIVSVEELKSLFLGEGKGPYPDLEQRKTVAVAEAELSEHLGRAANISFNNIEREQIKETEEGNHKRIDLSVGVNRIADLKGSIKVSVTFDEKNKITDSLINTHSIERGFWSNLALPFRLLGLKIPLIVVTVGTFLFLTWCGVLSRFLFNIGKLGRELGDFVGALPERGPLTLEQHLKIVVPKEIEDQWAEFTESLVKLPNVDADINTTSPERLTVFNTHRAEVFFSGDNLIEHHMAIGFYQSFPGVCTGVGLFGTFFAIFLGLNCLSVNPLTGQVHGIQDFINQLSGKFLSSILGILFALVFLCVERLMMDGINNQCLKLQHKLDRLYPQFVPERQVNKILQKVSEMSQSLGVLSESQDEQRNSLTDNIHQQTTLMKEFLDKKFVTDLKNSFKDSFAESMKPTMDKLLEGIANLETATERLKEEKQASAAEVIQRVVEQLTEQMNLTMQEFRDSLTSEARGEIQQLAVALKSTCELMETSNSQLSSLLNDTESKLREHQAFSTANFDSLSNHFKQLSEKLDATVSLQSASAEQQLAGLNSTINELIEGVRTHNSSQNQQLNSVMADLLTQTQAMLSENKLQNETARDSLNKALELMLKKIDATVEVQSSAAEQQLAGLYSTIHDLIDGVRAHNSEQNQRLNSVVGELLTQTQSMVSENRAQNEVVRENWNNSLEGMLRKIEESVDSQRSAAEQQLSGLRATMQELMAGVGKHNSEQNDRLNSVIGDMLAQTKSMLAENKAQNELAREKLSQTLDTMLRKVGEELSIGLESQRALLENAERQLVHVVEHSMGAIQRASDENMKRTSQFVSQLLEKVQMWLDTMTTGVSASSNQILSGVKEITNKYVEETRQGLLYSVQAVQSANSMMIQHLSEVNNHSIQSAKAVGEVEHVFKELEMAIQSATRSCNEQLSSLSSTNGEIHQTASDLNQAVKQLLGAQTQLQQASGLLSNNMAAGNEVIERFDALLKQHTFACKTVETSIASVLSSIQKSLGEYSEHTRSSLGNYLSEFDRSLSEAANRLSGTVAELDDRLDELTEVMQAGVTAAKGGV